MKKCIAEWRKDKERQTVKERKEVGNNRDILLGSKPFDTRGAVVAVESCC